MGLLSGGVYTQACASSADTTPIIGTAFDEATAIVANYNGGTMTSIVFKHHYLWAATRCYQWGRARDTASCEALGNLCVLSGYDSTSIPCKILSTIEAQRTVVNNVYGWSSSLPWLNYNDDSGSFNVESEVLWNDAVPTAVQLNEELTFYIARYAINGSFLGIERLEDQLSYCCSGGSENGFAPPTSTSRPWMFFGRNYKRSCTCSLSNLVARSRGNMDLFELYFDVGTSTSDTVRTLYPMPFRHESIKENSKPWPESLGDGTGNDVLHRRFVLYDVATGRAVEDGTAAATLITPRFVKYADRITVQVTLDSQRSVARSDGAIHPPSISIRYKEVALADLGDVNVELRVFYTMELTGWLVTQIVFFVLSFLTTFFIAGFRIFAFLSRNPTREMGSIDMLPFVARAFSAFFTSSAWPLFLISLPLTGFWMLFYKLTNRVFFLIPPNEMVEDYVTFKIFLHVALCSQLARMFEIIITQSNYAVFFVDWDKPRGKLLPIRMGKTMRSTQTNRDDYESDDAPKAAPLSIWRTLFAANEWAELQTQRSTSLEFTLFALVLILHGTGLENLARAHPNHLDLTSGACSGNSEVNDYLRYIQTIFWWLVLWSLQRLWTFAMSERILAKIGIGGAENPVSMFVDMCTLAKVSVVVLDEQFHGYYLHCCSPHEYGDCSMSELIDYLNTDAYELSTDRGLHWITQGKSGSHEPSAVQKACGLHGPPQTFEFIASPDWKMHFNSFLDKVHQNHADALIDPDRSKAAWMHRIKRMFFCCVRTLDVTLVEPDVFEDAYTGLTHFVSASINKDLQNYPMQEEPKGILQLLFGFIPKNWARPAPADAAQHRNVGFPSLLYPDKIGSLCGGKQPSVTSCFFLGVELELMLCNILVFTVIDMWAKNMVIAAFFTYAIERAMVALRKARGNESITSTSLLDPRFMF
jgi:meckelin